MEVPVWVAYQKHYAVAYNNKVYTLFWSSTQRLGRTNKQDGVVYKIPYECGKVYIGETVYITVYIRR